MTSDMLTTTVYVPRMKEFMRSVLDHASFAKNGASLSGFLRTTDPNRRKVATSLTFDFHGLPLTNGEMCGMFRRIERADPRKKLHFTTDEVTDILGHLSAVPTEITPIKDFMSPVVGLVGDVPADGLLRITNSV